MVYGGPPASPRPTAGPTPPQRTGDLVASIVLLVLAALFVVVSGLFALLLSAFLDYCPPQSCNAGGAVGSAWGGLAAAIILGVVGLALTLRRRATGSAGWPFALGALVLTVVACVAGFVGYFTLVG